jgi:tetratricopeptide (TPR) repeat protein
MSSIRFCCLAYLTIFLIILLAYFPSLSGEFILDDKFLIKNNPFIQGPHSLYHFFFQEDGIIHGQNWVNSHTGYYRPLVNFTYHIDYLLWGMNPKGFRLTNILLHLVVCLMFFHVLFFLLKNRVVAFWMVCIFALHPVNTEAVSWISSRNNLLVTFFALSSLFFFLKYGKELNPNRLILTLFFFILAVFTKEFGLMLLPFLVIYQYMFFEGKRSVSQTFIRFFPFFLFTVIYFILRKIVTGSWITPSGSADLFQRLYFVPYLLMWNIKLILAPLDLHGFVAHYPDHYLNWQIVISYVCLIGSIGLFWRVRTNRLAIFSALAFIISLIPILNVIRLSAVSLISMRWLYFPMIFVMLLFGCMIRKALESRSSLSQAILAVILVYMGMYTYILNKYLWLDENAFYSFEVNHFDNTAYYGGMGETLFNRGDFAKAEEYFIMAIKNHPEAARNYINYSALLIEKKEAEFALDILKRAENLKMTREERLQWHNNVGSAYFKQNHHKRAIEHIEHAIRINPDKPYLWGNLGVIHAEIGDIDDAIDSLKKGLKRFPDSIELKRKMAVIYLNNDEFVPAFSILCSIPQEKWKPHGIGPLYDEARRMVQSHPESDRVKWIELETASDPFSGKMDNVQE